MKTISRTLSLVLTLGFIAALAGAVEAQGPLSQQPPPPPPSSSVLPQPPPVKPSLPQPIPGKPAPTQPPTPVPAPPVAVPAGEIDPKAMALLEKVEARLLAIKTLSADFTWINVYPPVPSHPKPREFRQFITLRLMKPNYEFVDSWIEQKAKNGAWQAKGEHSISHVSDGQSSWLVFHDNKQFEKNMADPSGKNLSVDVVEPLAGFFGYQGSFAEWVGDPKESGQLISLKDLGPREWQGARYEVVEWRYYPNFHFDPDTTKRIPGGRMIETDDLYIGANGLIDREVTRYNIGWVNEGYLANIKIDRPMTRVSFAYTPPAGYHAPAPPPPLLANGTVAPDFTAQDAQGKPVKLSDYKGKVVVLDFWATWCGPCQEALPGTNQVASQFKDKNVVVLAINVWDTPKAFQSWLPQHKDFDSLVFAIDPSPTGKDVASRLYNVSAIPTQYVIGSDGRVLDSIVGNAGSEQPLETALKEAGAS